MSADAAKQKAFVPQQLIFYRVALGCEAAPGLGCGVKAKPVLRALACSAGVTGAWLKRNGTVIAVLSNEHSDPTTQRARVRSLLDQHLPYSHEIIGNARKTALSEFADANGWYRCDAVDSLSEEEAGIIATRLVRRMTTRVRLSDAKGALLRGAISEACRRELIDRPLTSAADRRRHIAEAVIKAGTGLLTKVELRALQGAASAGHRPTAEEQ